ncbi:MAG: endolytic transglycosylase MltG [Bdellovibrionaceae bacterium]|nr:endolytic transglycosylase MltG [Pseudobdellovibrionaceae bacterium]
MRIFFLTTVSVFLSLGCTRQLPDFFTEKEKQVVVDIKPEQGFHTLNANLQKQSLVRYPFIFKAVAKITSMDKNVRPGEYVVSNKWSYLKLLKIFKQGSRRKINLTIPEGFNIFQIAELLEQKQLGKAKVFLQLCTSTKFVKQIFKKHSPEKQWPTNIFSLEGYLFPDTYHFYKYDSEKSIINTLVAKFFFNYQKLALKKHSKLSRHKVITMASIVEKETGQAKERALIAGVFFNRLKKGMRLQTDPTILYGMWVNGSKSNNIRRKDILAYTKYNTYRIKALPIGPIANPGTKAIQAVFFPKKSSFLYFVSKNNGEHVFTSTYQEHLKYVRQYQLRRARRARRVPKTLAPK